MQAICRFWWYCPILHAICKICKTNMHDMQNMQTSFSICRICTAHCADVLPYVHSSHRPTCIPGRCLAASRLWLRGRCPSPPRARQAVGIMIQLHQPPTGRICLVKCQSYLGGFKLSHFKFSPPSAGAASRTAPGPQDRETPWLPRQAQLPSRTALQRSSHAQTRTRS